MSSQNQAVSELDPVRGAEAQTIQLPRSSRLDLSEDWIELVRQRVNSIQYGAVQIVVHGSRVVQIETTSRLRFDHRSLESGAQESQARGQ
jgi:hypothetical protein